LRAIIKRSKVGGKVRAPPSKSQAIRLIFYSLLSKVEIEDMPDSEDIKDAIDAVTALGVKMEGRELIPPPSPYVKENYVKFRGSATTLRFFIPIVASIGGEIVIDADYPLRDRPIRRIVEALSTKGVSFSSHSLPVKLSGKIKDDIVEIPGDESSQYVSGLIYGMIIKGGGKVIIKPPVSSSSYIKMTASLLKNFGSKVDFQGNVISVERGKDMIPFKGKVPGDYALSSFYAISSIITGGRLKITGLDVPEDYFGDHSIVEIFRNMGVTSQWEDNSWNVEQGELRGIKVNVDDAPDLAVSISALATAVPSLTIIEGVERLKIKESDRISTIITTVKAFGGDAHYDKGKIEIVGGKIKEGFISCPSDHRIAMMAGALATYDGGIVDNACCVNKSNPRFWKDLASLGAKVSLVG